MGVVGNGKPVTEELTESVGCSVARFKERKSSLRKRFTLLCRVMRGSAPRFR